MMNSVHVIHRASTVHTQSGIECKSKNEWKMCVEHINSITSIKSNKVKDKQMLKRSKENCNNDNVRQHPIAVNNTLKLRGRKWFYKLNSPQKEWENYYFFFLFSLTQRKNNLISDYFLSLFSSGEFSERNTFIFMMWNNAVAVKHTKWNGMECDLMIERNKKKQKNRKKLCNM